MTSMFYNGPLILISSIGIVCNGYILTAVLLTRQMSTANNILLLHLGTIDTLLGILFLVFSLPGFVTSEWLSDGLPCIIHGFLYNLLHPLVLWTICGLNCDRYYAIAAPLHYTHIVNAKRVLAGLGIGWMISVTLCIPPLFMIAPYHYNQYLEACIPNFSFGPGTLWYSTLYTAFTLLLPATLIICCNFKILMIARYHRHRIASAIYEVTLSAQVTITHQRNPFMVPSITAPGSKCRGQSAIYSIVQLVGSLAVLYLPYYSLIICQAFGKLASKIHPYFFTTAMILLICAPSVNGFLYGVKSKPLRKTFQNYWRKKQTKNEVNHEIQARTPSTCGSRRPSLTPLGFLTKPMLQSRLSDALFDVQKVVISPQKHKVKKIASPSSTNSLNILTPEDNIKIKQTTSCNTLQLPDSSEISVIIGDDDIKIKPVAKSTSKVFLRLFSNSQETERKNLVLKNIIDRSNHSPKITITRTYSEENESPKREIISKKHSVSSTTLLERKWRQLRDNENETPPNTKPLLENFSSDSSESSETKIYMTLDQKLDNPESQLLLRWPDSDHNYKPVLRQKTIQSQDV